VWSIAECAEHITLSEDLIKSLARKVAAEGKPSEEAKGNDERILKALVDRSQKAKAPEILRPTNKWKSKEEMIAEFKKRRDDTIEFIQTTPLDLRAHSSPHALFKAVDAYQWILLLSAHSERHTLQLNEVKTMPGYPK
jgi:hypothetical protein